MVRTILHTRVSDTFYFEQSPEEISHLIETTQWHNLSIAVQENIEHFDFQIIKLVEQHPEIVINGTIRRWQGTNSRCDFEGNVEVPPPNSGAQHRLVALILAIISVVYWFWVLDAFYVFSEPSFLIFIGIPIFTGWLFIMIVVGLISFRLIVKDNSDQRRWEVQQEMGWIIDGLHTLGTPLEDE